ncbi:MAG TPA: carbohydrate kinase family protein [Candidatus Thermoplasmatota archaeon]|nr:carbohydrate kinase family protein [Candidatus Thermoplasmatota archaeon]
MAPERRGAAASGVRPAQAASAPAFLAVCGHTNIDVQLQVKEIPKPGQSVPVLDRRTVWGGTACNIARHAAGLGVPVRLWSRVGDDFPADWRAALLADGVDLRFDAVKGGRTPTCYILTDLLDRQSYCMDQGPMAGMTENGPPDSLLQGMSAGSWLHLSTGEPLGYAKIAATARDTGLFIALDPGQELRFQYDTRTFEGLLDLSDALFVNEEELRVACDFLRYGDAAQFLDHVDTVVVTRGERGASLYRSGKKMLNTQAFPAKVVDPTGAGDALRSGWYAALHQGRTMEEALRRGQAAASIVLGHPGPQTHVVRPRELEALLKGG